VSRGGVRLTLLGADAHAPRHDRPTWRAFLQAARTLPLGGDGVPAAVLMGDTLDLASLTRHEVVEDDAGVTLEDEYDGGNEFLDEFDGALSENPFVRRNVRRHGVRSGKRREFLQGNHEYRLDRYLMSADLPKNRRRPPRVPEALRLRERGWNYVGRDKQEPYMIGGLAFHHGIFYPKHHAARHADELAVSNVYGHTHRGQQYARRAVGRGLVVATGLPALRTLVREWEHLKAAAFTGWSNGWGIVEWIGDRGDVRIVFCEGGLAAYGGNLFDGRGRGKDAGS
jgi:hypothetical protein